MSAAKKATKSKVKRKVQTVEEEAFVKNVIIRGEAVPQADQAKTLPPGATHWIVEGEGKGKRVVKRGRFSFR